MINKIILTLINKRYKIPEGDISKGIIASGIQRLNKELYPNSKMADERIVDYIVYFLYLRREPRYHFTEYDMFSEHAIEKYRHQFMSESGKSGINYYINQWLSEGGLTRHRLTLMIASPKPNKMSKFLYMPSEELIKKRFYNTDNGFMLCQQSTTGWAPKSEACSGCEYKERCMNVTAMKFPELIRLRKKDYENYDKEK